MFSKRVSFLAVFLLAFTGCSLKLNDKVTKPIGTVSTGSGCLSKAGDVLERFTNGTLPAKDHDEFYDCIDNALTTFVTHVDGKSKEHFEPQELGNFLSKYFLRGTEIQPALLREAFVLKRAIVGGSPDHISRAELRRVLQLFGALKNSTSMLRPVMPFRVNSFEARGLSSDQFEDVLRTFEEAITGFGEQIRNEQQDYSFDHLAALITELRAFLYKDKQIPADHWTTALLKVTEVIRPAKVLFVSPSRDTILAADWPKVFRLAPRYYAAFLRGSFYVNSAMTGFSPGGLQRIERAYSHFVDIFEFVLDQHDGRAISSSEIDDLIITLHKQELLGCQPETARAFVKAAFGRILGAAAGTEGYSVNKDSLNRFKENFRYGLEGLHAISALYRERLNAGAANAGPMGAREIESSSEETLLNATLLKSAVSREAVSDVRATPSAIRTDFFETTFQVRIPRFGESRSYSLHHMIRAHGLRTLNRLLIQAYGDSAKGEISEAQLASFMNDVFPIMLEWRIVDEQTRASVGKRLFEASLFLYSSDGSSGLTKREALELETLLISTVTYAPEVHTMIYNASKERGNECASLKTDERKKPTVPAACYRALFLENATKIWGYIPGLSDFVTGKSQTEKEELFDRMANFLRKGRSSAEDFSLSDTQAFVLLPYYIELLFSRFDANGDGFLDNAEANAAYPVFRPFLAAKAAEKGYTDDTTHRAIFGFLLAYRQLPTDDKLAWVIRRYILGDKPFRVDRGHVVEIFDKLMSL